MKATWKRGACTSCAARCNVPSAGEGAVPLPRPRQDMRIDGTLWTVDDAVDLHGLIRINLYRNGS